MTEATVAAALDRLDRALTRAERALVARAGSHTGIAEAYAQLEERHGILRARVQETLAKLDAMIGAG